MANEDLKKKVMQWLWFGAPIGFLGGVLTVILAAMGMSLPLEYVFGGELSSMFIAASNPLAIIVGFTLAGMALWAVVGMVHELLTKKFLDMFGINGIPTSLKIGASLMVVYLGGVLVSLPFGSIDWAGIAMFAIAAIVMLFLYLEYVMKMLKLGAPEN